MILTPGVKLEAVLAGAITTSQPEVHVSYRLYNTAGEKTKPTLYRTALNSASDVTLILDQSGGAIPQQGFVLEILSLNIYNKDTVSITVTVKTGDGTTERIVRKVTLLTLETLSYQKDEGWYATDANAAEKVSGISYSEGSWTPTDASGAGLAFINPQGTWEKIGRQVTARCSLTYPATADGSNTLIGGLPFTVANTTNARQGFVSVSSETTAQVFEPTNNATTVAIVTNSGSAVTNATMSGDIILGTCIYYV